MSLVRWGEEGSNVYLIGLDAVDGEPAEVQCVSCCTLAPGEVMAHLEWHKSLGHCVPQVLYDRLKSAYGIEP